MIFESPKDPDVTDRYGLTVDDAWLDGETITTVDITTSVDSGITISDISLINSPTISALFAGGNEGFWPIHFRINTPTRQREVCATLWVKQLC